VLQCYHRDVCENGFMEELNELADAVFLDLPAPHLAIPAAVKALKTRGIYLCKN
jgi:tRNA (adenine57-N1/adenine58-N1)-methyltransferase catalytic subunit